MGSIDPENMAADSAQLAIPIIDLAAWTDPSRFLESDRKAVARGLVLACHETGFAYIKNHGISSKDLDEAFSWSEKFFALPDEKKELAKKPDDSVVFRGWQRIGVEKANKHVEDHDESYGFGSDLSRDQPNVWIPEDVLPDFRDWALEFYEKGWSVGEKVLRALSVGLGLDEEHLLRAHAPEGSNASLRCYPPVPASYIDNLKTARLGAHTDFNSVTLLFQDDCGGLEVEDQNQPGQFIPVHPIKDAAVMNIADVLSRWSNDYLRSTRHRVLLPALENRFTGPERMTRARYSLPFFVTPKQDLIIDCLPGFSDEATHPAKYSPVTYGDFLKEKSQQVFADGLEE